MEAKNKKATLRITSKQWQALDWLVYLGFNYIKEELRDENLPKLKRHWKAIKRNYLKGMKKK